MLLPPLWPCGCHRHGFLCQARCISIHTAKEILRILPPFVTPVGLFVDQPPDEIRQIAGAHLRHLQLHGQESPQTVAAVSDFTILKAILRRSRYSRK